MKEICIIRHAKSDWGEEFLNDIDRHLNPRGVRDAYFMSQWYNTHRLKPDFIITSTATRAYSTAMIFARQLNLPVEQVKLEPAIYEAETGRLIQVIKNIDNSYKNVLLFGHNPGLTNLCNTLSDDIFFDTIPTCGMSSYQFAMNSWTEFGSKKGKLNFYEFPKNFKNYDF